MKINPKENLFDIPILRIRNLLKRYNSISDNIVASFLKINIEHANSIIEELIRLNYIDIRVNDKIFTHQNTIKGNAFAMSKAIAALSKEKAIKLFDGFLNRVEEVNNNEYYLYKVTKVFLFGSFITDASFVNDIDIAIELKKKDTDYNIFNDKNIARIKEAGSAGIRFNNFIEQISYSQTEVIRFLKSKSRYLSIHLDDEILQQTKTIQVCP